MGSRRSSCSARRSPSCACERGASTPGCSCTRRSTPSRCLWPSPASSVSILPTVRRAAIFVAASVFAPAAHAAPPALSVGASPARGGAPLNVILTAGGDPAAYHWDLGDGDGADGPAVQHVYAAGAFVARVTATSSTGETAQAAVTVTSLGLSLAAPRVGRYQQRLGFHGRLVPALR